MQSSSKLVGASVSRPRASRTFGRGGARLPEAPRRARSRTNRSETSSLFFVTINSNAVPRNAAEEELLWRLAERATAAVFAEENMPRETKFVNGFEGDDWDANVVTYRYRANVETGKGPNYGVHSHTTCVIKHNSRIHLDPGAIRDTFLAAWNSLADRKHQRTNVYVNIKAGSDNLANVIKYQEKDLEV